MTDYKNTIANSKASASDLLANISDKSVITGGGANAFGVAATAGYKYDAASKSYSFDATGADSAKTLSIINPNTGILLRQRLRSVVKIRKLTSPVMVKSLRQMITRRCI